MNESVTPVDRPGVSCIIPAYNEGARIERVLRAVVGHPLVDEVIVVDDGSKDGTPGLLRSHPGITLIVHEKNKGKSAAVATGIAKARNDLIMMIDSDLLGLTRDDITVLIAPVLSSKAEASISLRGNSLLFYKGIGLDFVSGERAFHKSLLEPHLSEMNLLPGFALEVFINKRIIEQHLKLAIAHWPNVISPRKREKRGFWDGTQDEFRMIRQIFRYVTPFEVIRQNYRMRMLLTRLPAQRDAVEIHPGTVPTKT